ncbi:Dynein-1-alpha heavy chain, flagellar inner arm I1 complex, putative, partial [Gryllus bimaculatus]
MSAKKKHIFGEREVIKSEDTLTREDMMKRVIFSQAHKEIKTEDLVPTHVVHSRVTDAIAKREAAENVSEPEPLCGYQDFQKGRGYPDEPRKHRDESLMSEEFDLTSDVPLRAITARSLVQKLKVTTIRTPEETEGRHAQTARKKRMKKPDLISQYELIRRAYSDKCLMYLVFAVTPDSVYYTPYSLKIVTFDDIESYNYMTMSRTGVSQYHPDGVMYTTLEEWKEEYDMYLDVIRIPAFRQFRMWKSFWIWRKAVKWAKMCLARNILLEELLILNKEIRVSLMDIQAMCCTMDNVSFINMKKEEHFAIFDYMEIQLGKVENTMVKIHEYHQIVKQIVTTSCYGALTSIGFTIDDSNFLPPEACAPSARRNVRDKRQRMQYIDQANKKKFCKRLTCNYNKNKYNF